MSKKEIRQAVGTKSLQSARVPACARTYTRADPKPLCRTQGDFFPATPKAAIPLRLPSPRPGPPLCTGTADGAEPKTKEPESRRQVLGASAGL